MSKSNESNKDKKNNIKKDSKDSVQKSSKSAFKKEIKEEFKRVLKQENLSDLRTGNKKNSTSELNRVVKSEDSHKDSRKPETKKSIPSEFYRENKPSGQRNKNADYPRARKADFPRDKKTEYNRNPKSDLQKENQVAVRREKGACPYTRECGGCNILAQSYEVELKNKQKTVEDLIKAFCKVEPIIGMKDPKNYRSKVHVVFDHDKKGNPISGVYEEKSHRVVAIDNCLIHNKKADEIIASIRGMLKSFKIKTYDEDSGYGLIRHVMIRTGFTSGEIMVVLVLSSPILPSKNNFVKALLKLHPEITTVVHNVNDKKTSMVLGEKETVIYGKGYIEDSLCGKTFRISPKSFYQVNPAQTEVLYSKAIEMAGLTGAETVVDAYCGIGTIGIIASDHVKKVIGVELNKDAVKDANVNVKRNLAANIDIYKNDAGDFMAQMAEQKEEVDVVFMDPPRTGSTEKFMDALVLLKPKKVVYISCNPVTLERDLQYLMKKGYKAQSAVPVDMFPWTAHVETVVLLSQQKPNDHIKVDLDLDELDVTSAEMKSTYAEIKTYVLKEHGLKVSSLNISQVKRKCGIEVGENYNLAKSEGARAPVDLCSAQTEAVAKTAKQPNCPEEKEKAIVDALMHYKII